MASKEKIEALKNNPKALKGMTQSEALIMRQLLDVEDMADELKDSLKDIDLRDLKYVKGEKGDTGERGEIGPRGETGPVGPRGEPGNDGHTPTRAEIEAIIIPLIEKPEKIDTTALVNEVLAQIPAADLDAIADIVSERIPSLSQPIRDSLELLHGNERLMTSAIHDKKRDKGLDAVLDDFEQDITKKTQTIIAGGGARQAYQVNVDTTNFNSNLSSADDTVQKALETLDDAVTGSSAFTGLTDTPSSYTGQAGKFAKVKATEDGLEFGSGDGIGDMLAANNLSDLADAATARTNLGVDAAGTDNSTPVTVTDSAEIDFTLTGQDITASLKAHSIDESKLDTSVNASLDLADSALQSSAIGTTVQAHSAVLDATTASFTTADETKLDGIAAGATANSSDATLLARANHTGTQSADTITDGTTNKAYTATEKTKLSGIADGAEVNVNADWNAVSGDAQILNKPTLGTAAALNTGTTNGTIPVIGAGDKLNSALIPDLAITEFLGNFTNLTAALADAGVNVSQKGDWFTTDEDKSYIVTTNNPTLSTHVTQLKTPTGGVSSVFSRTGAITAQSGDYTTAQVTEVTNLYFTDARALAAAPAETTTTVGSLISGATGKTTPVDADAIGLSDSAASNVLKSLTWANVKATLKTYFDTLYQASGSYLSNIVEDTTPQLGGNLDVNGKTITSASNGNINVAPNGTGDVIFNTNQLYVDTSSGHIGIGTATPTRNAGSAGRVLDFTASVGTAGIVAHSGGIESSWLINNGLGVYYDASGATDYNNNFIQFRLGDTNSNYTSLKSIMRLQPTGKVGIGTVSPNAMFDVVSTTPALSSAGTSDVFTIALPTNPAVSFPQAATLAVGTHQTHGGTTPYSRLDIKLKAAANTTVAGDTTVMTLLDNGNVGIGTTTPTAYLHIKAGTASENTAPIKLTAGTLNTTPESGAIEFDGTDFYFTI